MLNKSFIIYFYDVILKFTYLVQQSSIPIIDILTVIMDNVECALQGRFCEGFSLTWNTQQNRYVSRAICDERRTAAAEDFIRRVCDSNIIIIIVPDTATTIAIPLETDLVKCRALVYLAVRRIPRLSYYNNMSFSGGGGNAYNINRYECAQNIR